MTDLEAINARISRRNYTGLRMSEQTIKKLETLAAECSEKSGLAIRLIENASVPFNGLQKSYGMFSRVRSVFTLAAPIIDNLSREKAGYFGEYLILEATKMGLGTCWVGGSYSKSDMQALLPADEQLICVITVGEVPEKKGLKENLIYSLVHRKTKDTTDMYIADATPPEWFLTAMKAVQKAPSAVNRQPVIMTFKNGVVQAQVVEKHESDLIDLGIAKLHFELTAGGRFEWGNPADFKKYASI